MKKLAIGCGIALLVFLVVVGVGGYYLFNKASETLGDFATLREIPEIERGVRNTAAHEPPGSGELTAEQVSRYVQVQRQVRERLGARVEELNRQYAALSERMDRDEGTVLDAPQVIAAFRDLARVFVDAKRTQVEALNDAGFSLAEYAWVRRQVYAALAIPFVDMDISALIRDLRHGQVSPDTGRTSFDGVREGEVPEKNRALVEPHRKLLEDNAPLAFFGL
ncbi:MAG TPA: hypothetical protein VF198_18620 [Vicinamibacterales bacterium]